MRDYIDIGSGPANEPCAQVGQEGYAQQARAECSRFILLIQATLGEEPGSAHLAVKSNPHDFGTYYEVVCYYDDSDEEAARYANRCQDEAPTEWGEIVAELGKADPETVTESGKPAPETEFLGKPIYPGSSTVVKEAGCNFCGYPAVVDGRTTMGAWADMCAEHYQVYGVGIGVGYGQRFISKSPVLEDPHPMTVGAALKSKKRPTTFCGSCRDAAEEEGAPDDDESIGMILGEMGGDLADHDCDERDNGGCLCACGKRFRGFQI